MADASFDAQLRLLTGPFEGYLPNHEAPARYFFEEALKGADISRALDALIGIHDHAGAAISAIAAFDLRRGTVEHLDPIVRHAKYQRPMSDAIFEAVKRGSDPAPAVGLLVDHLAEDEYGVTRILVQHLTRGGSLTDVASRIAQHAKSAGSLGTVICAARSAGVDVASSLPLLAAQLSNDAIAWKAANAFQALEAEGVDIDSVVDTLGAALTSAGSFGVAERVAYTLARSFAKRGAWTRLDGLLAGRRADVRFAAFGVLCDLLGSRQEEVIDRVAIGILSPHTPIRDAALKAFKAAAGKPAPSASIVSKLAGALDDRDRGPGAAELLHLLPPEAGVLAAAKGRTSEAALRLIGALAKPGPMCAICARLPRRATWSRAGEAPEYVARLEAVGPLRRCPECGRWYAYSYEEEYEDMSHYEAWTLERLTPPETLRRLTPPALDEYRRGYDGVVNRLKEEVDHPRGEVRHQAAHDLMAHLIETGDRGKAGTFLAGLDGVAAAGALEWIERRRENVEDLLWAVRQHLTGPEAVARGYASWILSRRFVEKADVGELAKLLASGDESVLSAVVQTIWLASKDGFDASPFFERLNGLRRHHREEIRTRAAWTLTNLGASGKVDPLPRYLADLRSDDKAVSGAAAREIARLAKTRKDVATAVPLLIPHLDDWNHMETLKDLAAAGIDVGEAVPALVSRALTNGVGGFLEQLAAKGQDLRPHLKALASQLVPRHRHADGVLAIFRGHFKRGGDVSVAVAGLKRLSDDGEWQATELLAQHYAKRRDLDGLRGLLAGPKTAYYAISAMKSEQVDLAPVLGDLMRVLGHVDRVVREHAAEALVRYARDSKGRDVVLAAAARVGDLPGIQALKEKLA